MAELCDVTVKAGTAAVGSPWTLPELKKTMDFTAAPEHRLLGVTHDRIFNLRALGFEVTVTKGDDPLVLAKKAVPKPAKDKDDKATTGKAGKE